MSIKHKLLLSYSVIVLILIGISIYSIFQILHINKEYSTLMDERVYKLMETREIQNGTSWQGLYLRSYVLRQSDKNLEMFLESRETALKHLGEIAPLFINEEMPEQIQIIQEKQEWYHQYSDKVIDHMKKVKQDRLWIPYLIMPIQQMVQFRKLLIISFNTKQIKWTSLKNPLLAVSNKVLFSW